MVGQAKRAEFIQHRYTYTDSEKKQFIWIDVRSIVAYGDGVYDWTVWLKAENLSKQGEVRDTRFSLERFPSNFLALLAVIKPQVDDLWIDHSKEVESA